MTPRISPDDINVIALATRAKAKGNDDPSRIARRLLEIIARNSAYIKGREEQGRDNAFDTLLHEDNEFLAMCIVLIESTES